MDVCVSSFSAFQIPGLNVIGLSAFDVSEKRNMYARPAFLPMIYLTDNLKQILLYWWHHDVQARPRVFQRLYHYSGH